MLIGEICRISGLTKDTIRFYEKQGLIQVPRKDLRFNNYKEYSADTLRRLLVIKRLKEFGFTLNEVSEYLKLIELNQASCHTVSDKIAAKVQRIDEKIEELRQIRYWLTKGVEDCLTSGLAANSGENCPILTTDLFTNRHSE